MNDLFASLFEWFGLMPLFSADMSDHLRGWDVTCTGYDGTPWFVHTGWFFLFITLTMYALQYHIIDSNRLNKKQHWWLFALLVAGLDFLVAFTIQFNIFQSEDYCNQLIINMSDIIGFGISNAIWGFVFYVLLTSFPFPRKVLPSRRGNCINTTFWKP